MRSKKVIRYYCDHCSKGMFQRPAMARHEVVCYRNPKRQCHRCGNAAEHEITPQRKQQLQQIADDGGVIETEGDECPDCLMAFCIQTFRLREDGDWVAAIFYQKEQFKKDRDAWDKEPLRSGLPEIGMLNP